MDIRPLIQQKVQNQVGWEKKDISMELEPLGGNCEGGKVDMGRTLPWKDPLPAGMSTGTDRGAGGACTLLARSAQMLAC